MDHDGLLFRSAKEAVASLIEVGFGSPGVSPRSRGLGRPDPERSMSTRLAQRMPLTRNKKSRAMKKSWARKRSRSQPFGDPTAASSSTRPTFESMIEQEMGGTQPVAGQASFGLDGPNAADDQQGFAQEKNTFSGNRAVDPHEAFVQTQRVFEAVTQVMRSLAVSKGMTYFQSVQDNPEQGVVRIKINGMAPREVLEQFVRGVEDVEIELLEKPEGSEEENNLQGNWVFEVRLPDATEFEETDYDAERGAKPTATASRGEYPGEIVIPEAGATAGKGY